MGASTQTFDQFLNGSTRYSAGDNVYEWIGPACPPAGMFIPNTTWGTAVFPALVGSVYSGGAQDCGGGLAELGYYNADTGVFGLAAFEELRPGVPNPAFVDLDLYPPPAAESKPSPLLLLAGAAVVWALLK